MTSCVCGMPCRGCDTCRVILHARDVYELSNQSFGILATLTVGFLQPEQRAQALIPRVTKREGPPQRNSIGAPTLPPAYHPSFPPVVHFRAPGQLSGTGSGRSTRPLVADHGFPGLDRAASSLSGPSSNVENRDSLALATCAPGRQWEQPPRPHWWAQMLQKYLRRNLDLSNPGFRNRAALSDTLDSLMPPRALVVKDETLIVTDRNQRQRANLH